MDRVSQLALLAADRALADAGLSSGSAALVQAGIFVGNGSGPSRSVSQSYAALFESGRLPALTLLRCMHNSPANHISIRHGIRGPSHAYAAACASATVALGEALRAIRHSYIDVALVGGAEAPFGDGVLKAWDALRVLAPVDPARSESSCKPFARLRNGIVLGEGSAFFVLEASEHAASRDARIHAHLAGFGASSDGMHLTEPDVGGQVLAMQSALRDAGLAPEDIRYINAHGTGTKVGDIVEARSIAQVFGGCIDSPLVSSTKASHGHLLGASGAIELAASLAALNESIAPPTLNLADVDPECELNHVASLPKRIDKPGAVLSNSFAFGGTNACLIARRAPR
jgi:3-oxoacyl-[acyl-carrier-protein] synthase II